MKILTTPITVTAIESGSIQEIVELMIKTYVGKTILLPVKCGKLTYTLEIEYIDKLSYYVDLYYVHKYNKYRVCTWFYWTELNILM